MFINKIHLFYTKHRRVIMKNLKKAAALLLALAAASTSLAGCGSSQSGESSAANAENAQASSAGTEGEKEPVTIEFASWYAAEETTADTMYAMIDAFERKYDWITVNVTEYAYNNLSEQLLVRGAGGTAPDVSQVNAGWVASLVEMDVLNSMNDILPEDVLNDFYTSASEGFTYDGQVMAATMIRNPFCMYYNKTLLEKAGYTEDDLTDLSWDKFNQMCKDIAALKTNEDGNVVYGRSLSTALLSGTGYYFYNDLFANHAAYADQDGNITFGSEGTIAAFTQVQDLVKAQAIAPGLEIKENRTLFGNGQVGFHFDIASQKDTFLATSAKGEDFANEIGVAVVPGNVPTFATDHALVCFKQTEHPEECALLIDFLTGPEGMEIYTSNLDAICARSSASEIDYYQNLSPDMKIFQEAASTAEGLNAKSSHYDNAMLLIAEALQRVTINMEDPAAVVTEIDGKMKELYGQN